MIAPTARAAERVVPMVHVVRAPHVGRAAVRRGPLLRRRLERAGELLIAFLIVVRQQPPQHLLTIFPIIARREHVHVPDQVDVERRHERRARVLAREVEELAVARDGPVDPGVRDDARAEGEDAPDEARLRRHRVRELRRLRRALGGRLLRRRDVDPGLQVDPPGRPRAEPLGVGGQRARLMSVPRARASFKHARRRVVVRLPACQREVALVP
mmetsp:Transcript_7054/g.18236  ORF Transcript_7054/g.18236 Transcript_7054/m.18236 type:complete len:213 (-) Transcript_7054:1108-1746(-)